ncbi:MAG: hypothetical protein JW715_13090 [Sedimentisphaerales bacterium]|nr:hypothetical protein [Sedimentisphaerales bacterium]
MKRTSLLAIALLAFVAGTAQAAREYRFTTRPGVRWSPYTHSLVYGDVKYSPYAKEYGNSGLVYRRTQYHPRAKQYGSSGLVYDNVRYSPYAFGYNRSGLVADPRYGTCKPYSVSYYDGEPCIVVHTTTDSPECPSVSKSSGTSSGVEKYSRAEAIRFEQSSYRKQAGTKHDCSDFIRAYLGYKNIDYKVSRRISSENRLISIDFIIDDGKTIIKYWNPQVILDLKKQDGRGFCFFENYLRNHANFYSQFLESGGEVHQIIASDENEVLKQLLAFEKLNGKPEPDSESSEDVTLARADVEPPEPAVTD